jgi:hypothetical protein
MTATVQTPRNSVASTGGVGPYGYTFKILAAAELQVYLAGVLQLATAYAVAGVGGVTGGTVTFTVAPAAGTLITFKRATALAQGLDYDAVDAFPADQVEVALDRLTLIAQELSEVAARVFTAPVASEITDFGFPSPVLGGKFLRVKADKSGLELADAITGLTDPTTTRGDVIYRGAAALERRAVGAAGLPLVSDGTDPVYAALGAAGLAANAVETAKLVDAAVTAAKLATLLRQAFHGRCRLTKAGANLLLAPFNGTTLLINSAIETIPDAGVTLAATGLLANTTYYVYAFMAAGVMTLEAVPTGHSAQAATGVRIKTGDATRTLVGMIRIGAVAATFVDSATQRFVVSYFNRRPIGGENRLTANRTTASVSPTFAEIHTEIRCEVLTWGDEAVRASASGRVSNSAISVTWSAIGFDGTVPEAPGSASEVTAGSGVISMPIGVTVHKSGLVEGYHDVRLLGSVSAGTGTWHDGGAVGQRTALTVGIRG